MARNADKPATQDAAFTLDAVPRQQRSLWSDAARKLLRNRLSVVGLVIVSLLLFTAIFGPMLTAMLAIQKQLGCSENEAHTRAQALCPKTLQDAVKTLHEVMVFDFQIPAPADIPEYKSRERFFFLLGKYWEVYRAFLTHYMLAEGGYTPDPLMRFIMGASGFSMGKDRAPRSGSRSPS